MKIINTIIRFIVGLLFIFSGLIKVNDPVGTSIKLTEYMEVFGMQFMEPYALYLAVFLVVFEVVLGVALLILWRPKLTISLLLLLIVFFTALTFYSAFTGKVTDCGCFGDAIPLVPWESFAKDVILLVLIIMLFVQRDRFRESVGPMAGNIIIIVTTAFSLFLAIYAINHLPFIDFRAYKVGTDIEAGMSPSEELKYKYIMTKGGVDEEFTTYPTDTSYKYKDMILVNPEAQPKITDYNIWSDEGDYTAETFTGNKLMVIIYDVSKADRDDMADLNKLVSDLDGSAIEPVAITSSSAESFEMFRHDTQLAIPYYYGDATVLKTIIRANPGLVLVQDGVVRGKWHHNDVPDANEVKSLLK